MVVILMAEESVLFAIYLTMRLIYQYNIGGAKAFLLKFELKFKEKH